MRGDSIFSYFNKTQPYLLKEKQDLVDKTSGKKVIYFTFRTLHFLDWFAPIDLAIKRSFPEQYEVFYIDFSSTLHRIGNGFEYLRFREQLHRRMLQLNLSPLQHFSYLELVDYKTFPDATILVTTESIKNETFSISERIYLPHYALPKVIDFCLPKNIKFNHVFLPTKPPYTYAQLNKKSIEEKTRIDQDIQVHLVGYPKLYASRFPTSIFHNSDRPVVLFAPSLDISLLFDAIDKGIIKIFKKMSYCNFIIKLHPSIASRRHYVTEFIRQMLKNNDNIRFDSLTGLHDLYEESSIMITDFGSVGGEFRFGFGKPVVFIKTPTKFEGGADLRFRDDFADAICNVENLESTIKKVLKKGPLKDSEIRKMQKQVLSFSGLADERAAKTINKICSSL